AAVGERHGEAALGGRPDRARAVSRRAAHCAGAPRGAADDPPASRPRDLSDAAARLRLGRRARRGRAHGARRVRRPGRRHGRRLAPSLAEVYRTVPVAEGSWWRKALAFAGPGYLVAVGYMDPGNWATDLGGGSRFGYSLLSVILLSNLMAILLQGLAAKLGIATGRDLAQACRDHYSRPVSLFLWVLCEIAIAACDLAEVIGSAIGLNLLFGIPLPWGFAITAADVIIVLFLQHHGFRYVEALVVALIATIAGCFLFEIVISRPDLAAVAWGFLPRSSILADRDQLYI